MHLIRKISIGRDYKNEAMHYAVGQEVYGGHIIHSIVEEEYKYNISDIQFSPDGSKLASCSIDNTIRIWNMAKKEEYSLLKEFPLK